MIHTIRILLLFTMLIAGCHQKSPAPQEPMTLNVLKLESSPAEIYVEMSGEAEAIPTVDIVARVEGYLQSWSFREGDMVKKGQLLFSIEKDTYRNTVDRLVADVAGKTATWEKATLDEKRLQPLSEKKAISGNDYDVAVTVGRQAKADLDAAKAELAQACLELSYTDIHSPISGYIGKANVKPGNLIRMVDNSRLATVSAIDPIYFNFQLNETDFLKLRDFFPDMKGLNSAKAHATLADKSEYPHVGTVDFIDRALNPTTGTIAMRAKFPNPDNLIKPGNYAFIRLVLGTKPDAIVVPQSAVMQLQDKHFVFVVDDSSRVHNRSVMVGNSFGNKIIITQGLKAGEILVREGFQKLRDEMKIEINHSDSSRHPSKNRN